MGGTLTRASLQPLKMQTLTHAWRPWPWTTSAFFLTSSSRHTWIVVEQKAGKPFKAYGFVAREVSYKDEAAAAAAAEASAAGSE
jgi:hypothetical protein